MERINNGGLEKVQILKNQSGGVEGQEAISELSLLSEEIENQIVDNWRNLVGIVSAYGGFNEKKRHQVSDIMKESVAKRVGALEEISLKLEKIGIKNLRGQIEKSLEIIKGIDFAKEVLDDSERRKEYEKKVSQLSTILDSAGEKLMAHDVQRFAKKSQEKNSSS